MKRAKKRKRNLQTRVRDWENMVQGKKIDAKAYRKPGSNQ